MDLAAEALEDLSVDAKAPAQAAEGPAAATAKGGAKKGKYAARGAGRARTHHCCRVRAQSGSVAGEVLTWWPVQPGWRQSAQENDAQGARLGSVPPRPPSPTRST